MVTLAIDTSTKVCTVALVKGDEVIASYEANIGLTHSEALMVQIDQLFTESKTDFDQISKIAVSIGPGSFTGLRIGLATAEAMAYSWKCELCGVNTLKALAYNIQEENILLAPVLDAQKGNYYLALYTWQQGKLIEKQAVEVVSKEELFTKIASYGMKTILLGECDKLVDSLKAEISLASEDVRMPKATSVAQAANAGSTVSGKEVFGITPYYIRKSEAEELWEKKQQALQSEQ